MELKKKPSADLEKKRGLFFSISLAISLLLVNSAFQWETAKPDTKITPKDLETDELLISPPVTDHEPPKLPKPVVRNPIIQEVEDDIPVEEVEAIFDPEELEPIIEVPVEKIPDEIPDETFTHAETMPEPIGGLAAFYSFLAKTMRYPNVAKKLGIEGKVYVQFVIDKEGKLSDIRILKGIGGGCDEEALRVLKLAPNWSPGKQRGVPVKVQMVVPIYFKLDS